MVQFKARRCYGGQMEPSELKKISDAVTIAVQKTLLNSRDMIDEFMEKNITTIVLGSIGIENDSWSREPRWDLRHTNGFTASLKNALAGMAEELAAKHAKKVAQELIDGACEKIMSSGLNTSMMRHYQEVYFRRMHELVQGFIKESEPDFEKISESLVEEIKRKITLTAAPIVEAMSSR